MLSSAKMHSAAPKVEQRLDMRVALLIRYPFKTFSRVFDDRERMLRAGQSVRRPWRGED
jgi:hypothetical protein